MAQRTIYECDECKAEQRATNHWFVGVIIDSPPRIMFGLFGSEETITGENKQVFHLCGEGCVAKCMSEFFAGLTRLTAPLTDL
jgi:hypothetical protein